MLLAQPLPSRLLDEPRVDKRLLLDLLLRGLLLILGCLWSYSSWAARLLLLRLLLLGFTRLEIFVCTTDNVRSNSLLLLLKF